MKAILTNKKEIIEIQFKQLKYDLNQGLLIIGLILNKDVILRPFEAIPYSIVLYDNKETEIYSNDTVYFRNYQSGTSLDSCIVQFQAA